MKYFCEVCQWRNITKAAEVLHVSQPTISIAMQTIEAETGLNLFRRDGKKIYLTRDSNLLLEKIRPVLETLNELERSINDIAHKRNHIRFALPPQISLLVLPLLFGPFQKEHPDILLEIMEDAPENSLHLLKEEKLDVMLMPYADTNNEDFVYQELGRNECYFCTWPENPLARYASITIQDIQTEPLVLNDSTFHLTHLIQQRFHQAGYQPNVIHYSPYLHTVRNLVTQHIASAFLTRQAILPKDDIVAISLKKPLYFDVGIITKRGRHIYDDERILINFIKKIYN